MRELQPPPPPYPEDASWRKARFVAKRYTYSIRGPRPNGSSPTYILVFAHALGFHKECWEPTISLLLGLGLEPSSDESSPVISQMWTVDCPDHGESAMMNEEAATRFSCHWYASAIYALSRSEIVCDLQTSRLVLIGHSAGAIAVTLATTFLASSPRPCIKPHAVVLIEPWMIPPALASSPRIGQITAGLVSSTRLRRDVWGTLDEAREYFQSKKVWQAWDPTVLTLYLAYCLKHRSSPSQPTGCSVGLTYSKSLECDGYGDLSEGQAALAQLSLICKIMPVHVIFGAGQGSVPEGIRRAICDPSAGREMASVTVLPDLGHMAPQQSPPQIATALWNVMVGLASRDRRGLRAKL
ncbi:hypothetical protein VTO73DRAFT_7484 [Trametes versicolor]